MSTRDRIPEEALTLFAENRYDGTGVEQIAEKVGIMAPSLYMHFKGKEDILNALIDSAEEHYEESFLSIEPVSPVVLWVSKAGRQPQYEKEIMESIEKHIRHFCDVYMKE